MYNYSLHHSFFFPRVWGQLTAGDMREGNLFEIINYIEVELS